MPGAQLPRAGLSVSREGIPGTASRILVRLRWICLCPRYKETQALTWRN
jgi:hypothetical protein